MPLTFAFSTAACPGWEFRRMVDVALELGFGGIEFAGLDSSAIGPLLASAGATRELLDAAGLSVCALATSLTLDARDADAWKRSREAIVNAAGLARAFGAPALRVLGQHAQRGESVNQALVRIARRLRDLAIDASASDQPAPVRILLQNGGSFVRPKELWSLLEVANCPEAGLCWDAGEAALPIGGNESPALAVHTLNTRLRLIHLWDHTGTPRPVPLGEGIVRGRLLVERLRGIGYDGCIVYAPPPGTVRPEEVLPHLEAAAAALKGWCGLNVPAKPVAAATGQRPTKSTPQGDP